MDRITVVQGTDQIVASGSFVVTRQSPPVLIDVGGDGRLLIAFDLDAPFTRATGVVVKPTFDAAAVSLRDTPSAPKVTAIGNAGLRVEYYLTPTAEPPGVVPDERGITARLSFNFIFRVLRPATDGLMTPAPRPFEWLPPVPVIPQSPPPAIDPRLLSWEERARQAQSGFFAPPRKHARAHEVG